MRNGEIAVDVSEALAAFVVHSPKQVPPRARGVFDAARAAIARTAPVAQELTEALALFGTARVNGAVFSGDPAIGESGAVVAGALAGGELAGASEERIVAAIAIGCEVAARLRRAVVIDPAWDAATVVASFGAVAAAAHVFALEQRQARDALGLAATQATGPALARGTTAGAAAFGKAAGDAVEAAILARHGFTAAPAAIEGRRGFAALMASGLDEDALLAGLGEEWTFADP